MASKEVCGRVRVYVANYLLLLVRTLSLSWGPVVECGPWSWKHSRSQCMLGICFCWWIVHLQRLIFWYSCRRLLIRNVYIFVWWWWGVLLSKKMPLGVCHGYFRMVHMHVSRCYVVLSWRGACLWNNACWQHCISLAMGFVRMLLCGSWRQSTWSLVVRWNIRLWIILGFFCLVMFNIW